jgi:alkaline phosphatase D
VASRIATLVTMESSLPSRRDVLRWAAAAGGASAVAACGDNLTLPLVAAFEVDATTAVITAHAPGAGRVRAIVETEDGREVAAGEAVVGDGGTAHVDIAGLAPGTTYRYRVVADGAPSPTGWLTTAPDDPRAVRLAVIADLDVDPEFDSPILDHLTAAGPDLVVSLGDFPYTDNAPGAITRDEYRSRHLLLRSADKVDRWLRTTSLRAIYDDHEVRNNWDAASMALDPVRHADALAVWDEWFPVRGAPPDARYRSWRWGPLVECFLLDCRRHRSDDDAPDGPGKVMLGDRQRAWLEQGLAASTASFKLVFTTVPLDFGWGLDHWAGYTVERDRLLAAIRAADVAGVLFLSGDQHWFAAHAHASGAREFQVGPIARGTFEPPPAVPGVLARAAVFNAGVVDVDLDDAGPRLIFTAVGADGAAIHQETLRPDDLRLRR